GLREIRMHQRKNNRVVLLTASLYPLIETLGEFLGVDDAIATKLVFDNGVATGEVEKPYCYEDGKRVLALEYADRYGVPMEKCWFYSDSVSDLPLMEAVGHPAPTNPDPVLWRIGFIRNWRMKFFYTVLPRRKLPPQ
ncbi:MAG: HAD family phosphatase, partial [bacterium]